MREIQNNVGLVASCGLYCGACRSYLKERCKGCHENVKASWCKIRTCCIEKKIASCASCVEHPNPKDCGKFNNVVSKVFAIVFRSDRAACIAQIRELGLAGHAQRMTELKLQSLKR